MSLKKVRSEGLVTKVLHLQHITQPRAQGPVKSVAASTRQRVNNNDISELIGIGRTGRVMRFGNIAVRPANIWTVPEDASETTTISNEQLNEQNIRSLKHEASVYRHLGNVKGVTKLVQVADAEIQMPYLPRVPRRLFTHPW